MTTSKNKKRYEAPQLSLLGAIETLTAWTGHGAGEFFGGTKFARIEGSKPGQGPCDLGS